MFPSYAVRVLHTHHSGALVGDLVRLGLDRAAAAEIVRRGSGTTIRIDGIAPIDAQLLTSIFRMQGGFVHTGPSLYRDRSESSALDAVVIGTTDQIEALCAVLAADGQRASLADSLRRALTTAHLRGHTLRLGKHALDLSKKVAVMGILNVTPDSFHDGGRYLDPRRAVDRGLEMVAEGADIIDVGGDSASGDAAEIDAAEEIRRIEPVIRALASQIQVPIAIDTHRSRTAAAALDAGASMVNDITGFGDPAMARAIAAGTAAACVMHIKGVPKKYPPDWHYRSVMGDIIRFLDERTTQALSAGVAADRICVDPGIEFGKLVGQDLEIFRRLEELHILGFPVLIAASRKTIVGHILGGLPSSERFEGTAVLNTYAITRGARIIRVHDVRAMARVARVTEALLGMAVDGTPLERARSDGVPVDESELLAPRLP